MMARVWTRTDDVSALAVTNIGRPCHLQKENVLITGSLQTTLVFALLALNGAGHADTFSHVPVGFLFGGEQILESTWLPSLSVDQPYLTQDNLFKTAQFHVFLKIQGLYPCSNIKQVQWRSREGCWLF